MKQHLIAYRHLRVAVLLFLTAISPTVMAQKSSTGNFDGKRLLIATNNGFINIVPYTPEVFRVSYQQKSDQQIISYSTVGKPQAVKAAYRDDRNFISI